MTAVNLTEKIRRYLPLTRFLNLILLAHSYQVCKLLNVNATLS